ncbi:50S ribosomal protein L4 [Rhodocaloribacter litoris]|uniref:50S ribosomal protein L4 n=1 Tax=Rhodocaloribacter litoris TaxID=2558931 RepID=UPI001421F157|nr:50S ribosomal protein L4 [Rhodocaloribacter litoris]QXD16730.1 50S ribosomal protein L4 [Rhodocaloribacter litoris]GIV59270.1 MAG: 50S ribosomal protein L4 [Rhodothermaceae bacterium]
MELKVYRQDGSEAGTTVTLDASVFDVEPNDHAIWLDVRRIQANARQGTHKVKERSENAHSTRKLYRQKGTGYARAGDAKSPIRRSGGTIFGPRPRTYGLKVNRKTQQLARRSALTYKAREEAIRVVEDFSLEAPSTRWLEELLAAFGVDGRRVLILTAGHQAAVYRSGRNVPKVTVREARNASTLDLLGAQVVLMQVGALEALTAQLGQAAPASAE